MIVREFYKTRKYSSAIDVEDAPFEYIETDLPIEKREMAVSNTVEE